MFQLFHPFFDFFRPIFDQWGHGHHRGGWH